KNQMAAVLSAADACIAILKPIELYRTTYPNKVFDYMAAGKPVILAIGGVISNLVTDEGAGIVIPPGDPPALAQAIRVIADDQEMAQKMGEAGRNAVEQRYNRKNFSQQFARLLEDMVR
ncbi:MAG: glycosyltransferase, partial [Bellilinea sp.]